MLTGQPDFEVVAEAADGREAVAQVSQRRPDVVLMDLRMPELDGVGAIEQILAAHPATRILVLTTYDADRDIVRALEAGRHRRAAQGRSPRGPLPGRSGDRAWRVRPGERRHRPAPHRIRQPPTEAPSEREIEVLTLVARGLTNRAIGRQLAISEATVKTHLVHVFAKLGVTDRTSAVTAALERGLIALPGSAAELGRAYLGCPGDLYLLQRMMHELSEGEAET